MADSKTPLLGSGQVGSAPEPPPKENAALYYDSTQTPVQRYLQISFVAMVVIMVLVSLVLSLYRGITYHYNGALYLLLGICMLGLAGLEVLLIYIIRKGDFPKEKTWFLFFMGFCILLQGVFTDILVFY
ncbi:PREDICTED: uncharacterized protein LOC109466752 [Branchiostoma belcheri]|uniref:Uncharacterized protein LOC109466752 n=1 Tax=Branchiostoma belcheri TaxID=7741 RepID=A0A6P4Y6L1_BRABE|nr:PREDICTED: uncharacterized protein LOC109466752 [Branchiostoma belcheri]